MAFFSGGSSGGSGGGGNDDPIDPTLGEVIGGVSSSGLADISLSASYSHDLGGDNYLDLTGRVTLPTGDEAKDLGTGETDYTLLAEVGHDFDGAGVYAFGGYKLRGGASRADGAQCRRPLRGLGLAPSAHKWQWQSCNPTWQ